MSLMKNKAFAWLIAALMILLSIFISGSSGLNKIKGKTLGDYTKASNGKDIHYSLDKRADISLNYVKIAKKYLKSSSLVTDLETGAAGLTNAGSMQEKYAANLKLTGAFTALYEALKNVKMSDSDAGYRQSLFVDLNAEDKRISHDSYNDIALAFNIRLESFPASLFKMFGTVKPIEYFGEE